MLRFYLFIYFCEIKKTTKGHFILRGNRKTQEKIGRKANLARIVGLAFVGRQANLLVQSIPIHLIVRRFGKQMTSERFSCVSLFPWNDMTMVLFKKS